jgi:hypothetical protein
MIMENNEYQLVQLDMLDQLLKPLPCNILEIMYPEYCFYDLRSEFSNGCIFLTHDIDFYIPSNRFDEKIFGSLKYKLGFNPLNQVKKFLALERQYNFYSTFFIPSPQSYFKAHAIYKIDKILSPDYEIGLHTDPSSIDDIQLLIREKKSLEHIIKKPVRSHRVHTLRFRPKLFELLDKTNFVIDFSFGYNNAIGLRGGIGYLFKPKKFNVFEVPTILMDITLFRDLRLSLNKALKLIERIVDTINKEKLLVSVIWHTDYIEYKEYEFLYNKFLENIYSKNINVITPKIMENYFKAILNNL